MSTRPDLMMFGASGPAGREFLAMSLEPSFPGRIEHIVAARAENEGKLVGETALAGFAAYDDMTVLGPEEALRSGDAPVIVSFLRDDSAEMFEPHAAEGRVLLTNSGFLRMDSKTALSLAYTNPGQIDELFPAARGLRRTRPLPEGETRRVIANGNCTSGILSVPLAPLHERWGVTHIEVSTLQGWSGAGKPVVPEEAQGLVEDIHGSEKSKIETEPNRLLSATRDGDAGIGIDATPRRGPWWRGHLEKVTVTLAQPATADEIIDAWRDFRSPEVLHEVDYGPNSPRKKPLKVAGNPLVIEPEDQPPQLLKTVNPMRVKVYLADVRDEGRTAEFQVLGDNLALGSAGGVGMNLAYMVEMGYLL